MAFHFLISRVTRRGSSWAEANSLSLSCSLQLYSLSFLLKRYLRVQGGRRAGLDEERSSGLPNACMEATHSFLHSAMGASKAGQGD